MRYIVFQYGSNGSNPTNYNRFQSDTVKNIKNLKILIDFPSLTYGLGSMRETSIFW